MTFDHEVLHALRGERLVYLATPYTHFEQGTHAAHLLASRALALCWSAGVSAFSPIAHSHAAATMAGIPLPGTHAFWMDVDRPLMDAASALAVVMLDGWDKSRGVAEEIATFRKAGKPVYFLKLM